MENQGKKSVVKTILVIAAGVAIGYGVAMTAEWGIKKLLKK